MFAPVGLCASTPRPARRKPRRRNSENACRSSARPRPRRRQGRRTPRSLTQPRLRQGRVRVTDGVPGGLRPVEREKPQVGREGRRLEQPVRPLLERLRDGLPGVGEGLLLRVVEEAGIPVSEGAHLDALGPDGLRGRRCEVDQHPQRVSHETEAAPLELTEEPLIRGPASREHPPALRTRALLGPVEELRRRLPAKVDPDAVLAHLLDEGVPVAVEARIICEVEAGGRPRAPDELLARGSGQSALMSRTTSGRSASVGMRARSKLLAVHVVAPLDLHARALVESYGAGRVLGVDAEARLRHPAPLHVEEGMQEQRSSEPAPPPRAPDGEHADVPVLGIFGSVDAAQRDAGDLVSVPRDEPEGRIELGASTNHRRHSSIDACLCSQWSANASWCVAWIEASC